MEKFKKLIKPSAAIVASAFFGFIAAAAKDYVVDTVNIPKQLTVTTDTDPLNVRCGPSINFERVGELGKGLVVDCLGKIGDWYVIHDPDGDLVGAVSGDYVKANETSKSEKTPQNAGDSGKNSEGSNPENDGQQTEDGGENSGGDEFENQEMKNFSGNSQNGAVPPEGNSGNGSVQNDPSKLPMEIHLNEEREMLSLIDEERKNAGVKLQQYEVDETLTMLARAKAYDMVQKNYISHESQTYGLPFDMMKKYGVTYKSAGENIARNSSVQAAHAAFINSPQHKENILNASYNAIGVGIANGPGSSVTVVEMFIER